MFKHIWQSLAGCKGASEQFGDISKEEGVFNIQFPGTSGDKWAAVLWSNYHNYP